MSLVIFHDPNFQRGSLHPFPILVRSAWASGHGKWINVRKGRTTTTRSRRHDASETVSFYESFFRVSQKEMKMSDQRFFGSFLPIFSCPKIWISHRIPIIRLSMEFKVQFPEDRPATVWLMIEANQKSRCFVTRFFLVKKRWNMILNKPNGRFFWICMFIRSVTVERWCWGKWRPLTSQTCPASLRWLKVCGAEVRVRGMPCPTTTHLELRIWEKSFLPRFGGQIHVCQISHKIQLERYHKMSVFFIRWPGGHFMFRFSVVKKLYLDGFILTNLHIK